MTSASRSKGEDGAVVSALDEMGEGVIAKAMRYSLNERYGIGLKLATSRLVAKDILDAVRQHLTDQEGQNQ